MFQFEGFLLGSLPEPVPSYLTLAYTGYRISLVRPPSEPFSKISQAYEYYFEGEGWLVPQWGVLGSTGEVSWLLPGELKQPAQDGCIWFLHRLRTC